MQLISRTRQPAHNALIRLYQDYSDVSLSTGTKSGALTKWFAVIQFWRDCNQNVDNNWGKYLKDPTTHTKLRMELKLFSPELNFEWMYQAPVLINGNNRPTGDTARTWPPPTLSISYRRKWIQSISNLRPKYEEVWVGTMGIFNDQNIYLPDVYEYVLWWLRFISKCCLN